MINIVFRKEDITLLLEKKERSQHAIVRRKATALYLKSLGTFSRSEICIITNISRNTLFCYLKSYLEQGIKSVTTLNSYRPKSELEAHSTSLKEYFEEHPVASIVEAQAIIKQRTGIARCPTQIRAFLKRMGMKIRKVGYVPGKSCEKEKQEEQAMFLKKN